MSNGIRQTRFIIIREDRAEDPKTVIAEGLRIGRAGDSEVWLNHPHVSRVHAGVNRLDEVFFLISLSASNPTTLNGRVIPFNEIEAIVEGDEIQIGPFFLQVEEAGESFCLRVSSQFAVGVGEREAKHKYESYQKQITEVRDSGALRATTGSLIKAASKSQAATSSELSNALKVFWGKRTREKAGRPSPLHPHKPPRLGKVRFNWSGTRDLVRPWPFAIFFWTGIVVAACATLAAFAHKNAFAPEEVSSSHTRNSLMLKPAIAKQTNGNSCTSCHATGVSFDSKDRMDAKCASCHQTESFIATVIPKHRDAGIGCVVCHSEHRGASFRPMNAALESCTKCHNDQNHRAYNGKTVHTPHGATWGYPVNNGVWVWTGLDDEELAQRPELIELLKKNRVNSNQVEEWRNAQFHAIHLNGIRVVTGIDGATDENGNTVLSCSSCHKTGYMGANVDRTFPRTTCGKCHNAEVFNEPFPAKSRSEAVSCTSCHVQHVKDAHWAAELKSTKSGNTSSPN